MNCQLCDKPIENHIKLNHDLGTAQVCFDCFFDETIPDPVGRQDPNYEKLHAERGQAITIRAHKVVEEVKEKMYKN